MSQYWLANVPGSTLTSSQAEYIAVIGRNLASTAEAKNLALVASTTVGQIVVSGVTITSAAADVSHVLSVGINPTSRIMVSTAMASANGVVCNVASNVGQLKIRCYTTAGSYINRYILLFSS